MPESGSKKPSGFKIWEPLLLSIMVVIGMFAGQKMLGHQNSGRTVQSDHGHSQAGDRIEELVKFVETRYVDDVNSDELVEKAIEAVLSELDPHSSYISPEQLKELDSKMQGSYEGIGIEFDSFQDTLVVIHVIPNSPAEESGLRIGDYLISANDTLISGTGRDYAEIVQHLKGIKGSDVHLKVLRKGEAGQLDIKIVRNVIPIPSVPAALMLDDKNGYIKIDRFGSNTYKEFMDEVERLIQKEGMENIVIDVRQNPGGYLQEAVNILSQLFEQRNELLVYTEGDNSKRTEYKTTGNRFFQMNKVAVLIDEGSASASEILAGAIQDHDRGVVIGTRSFGKGLVQEQYDLNNGGALRLTIARYYTPSGRLIQRPYVVGHNGSHEDTNSNDVVEIDSTEFYTTNGRVVYGEGGIKPDVVVQNYANWKDPEFKNIYHAMVKYSVDYLVTNQVYDTDYDTFKAKLPSDRILMEQFQAHTIAAFPEMGAQIDTISQRIDLAPLVRSCILAYGYGHDKWYTEMATYDPLIIKAKQMLKSDQIYTAQLQ